MWVDHPQSLEEATIDGLVAYRAALRVVDGIEAKMDEALLPSRTFDPGVFHDLQTNYIRLLCELRDNRQILESMLEELGYIPATPELTSFHWTSRRACR